MTSTQTWTRWGWRAITFLSLLSVVSMNHSAKGETLRAGIIGCDTSHVIAFTQVLNAEHSDDDPLSGVRVVAAFPGGSEDIASSRDRVEGFTEQLRKMDVEIVSSIDELLKKVDVVLLESVDGRPHLEQLRPVIEAGKPVFVDKPFAVSVADAVTMFGLAEARQVPIFSSSMLRFVPEIAKAVNDPNIGEITGCDAYSPCSIEPTHPDLFWYGIHGVEILYTIMGPGCERVTRTQTDGTDVVTGVWNDGRIGTFRGLRTGRQEFGALVFGTKSVQHYQRTSSYESLLAEIVQFFKTGVSPVSPSETLEILAFMEAAEKCKANGGDSVLIKEIMGSAETVAVSAK